jgi:DNA invertase Pin-like site-specific DNA recombinase
MLATIAAQDSIKISENTKAALAKKKATGMQLGAPTKSAVSIDQVRRLKAGDASSQAYCPNSPDVTQHRSKILNGVGELAVLWCYLPPLLPPKNL